MAIKTLVVFNVACENIFIIYEREHAEEGSQDIEKNVEYGVIKRHGQQDRMENTYLKNKM